VAITHGVAPGFTVGAICVIERSDGRILLVRHSYRQRWGFPGGLLKRGEQVDAGALREAKEEVGLDIELIGEPAVVVAPIPRRVDVIYRARPAGGVDPDAAIPTSPEITEARWVARDDLPELQHEAAGGLVALARVTDAAATRH
jgi:ADP-ribose pyrophosphatase YjhB (NUDIX family)